MRSQFRGPFDGTLVLKILANGINATFWLEPFGGSMETEADLHGIHAIHACSFGHYDYHQRIPPEV